MRAKCGSVIIADNDLLGRGFNSPPGNLATQRRCTFDKHAYDLRVTDKTCCVHAEVRAILDAVSYKVHKIPGSTLYFARVDSEGRRQFSGAPYCTICSKLALDAEIKDFVLWHPEGVCVYDTEEYNDLSYRYCEKKP